MKFCKPCNLQRWIVRDVSWLQIDLIFRVIWVQPHLHPHELQRILKNVDERHGTVYTYGIYAWKAYTHTKQDASELLLSNLGDAWDYHIHA
jgi:hypothetical protein